MYTLYVNININLNGVDDVKCNLVLGVPLTITIVQHDTYYPDNILHISRQHIYLSTGKGNFKKKIDKIFL